MKCLLQRVSSAKVVIEGQTVGEINAGLLVFVCAEASDNEQTIDKSLQKILNIRIFNDENMKMNLNIKQTNGGLLLVSQFTLAADTRRGNRPGFSLSAPPSLAEPLFNLLVEKAKTLHPFVETGHFGADMQVHLVNDGPVTIPLDID